MFKKPAVCSQMDSSPQYLLLKWKILTVNVPATIYNTHDIFLQRGETILSFWGDAY